MQLLCFAALKDHFPASRDWNAPIPSSVQALRMALERECPEAAPLLKVSRFAINQTLVEDDHPLQESDEVAVLPPSSGG